MTLAAHPAAKLFPILEGDDLRALADDIRERGLLHAGVVWNGLLLDGRNRQRACAIAGVEFTTRTLRSCDSPTAYVLSANLKRRHLTPIQRAAVAVESLPYFAREAKERQRAAGGDRKSAGAKTKEKIGDVQTARNRSRSTAGEATTRAARAARAGTRNTKVLAAIRKRAPDVFAAVKAGLIVKVSEARTVGALPQEQRSAVLASVRGGGAVKKAVREVRAEATAKAVAHAKRKTDRYHVVHATVAAAHQHVKAESVDLILTDPPYEKAAIPLYAELAKFAVHALRPGGSLLVMTGQMYMPDWLAQLTADPGLAYHWTIAYLLPGGQSSSAWTRSANNFWKPVFWFVKGGSKPPGKRGDVVKSDTNDNDKRFHGWGQSESGFARLVERWSEPDDLVCDPFCGGGTTGVVALRVGRRFVGLDVDQVCIDQTVARLRNES